MTSQRGVSGRRTERGRKTRQGMTMTQGKAQRGSWLPTRIPYRYLGVG